MSNLLKNSGFDSGTSSWYIEPMYAENNVTWASSGGASGGCVKMTITRTNDPGMCVIRQSVTIKTGYQYRLSFSARRSGKIDIWARTKIDGKTVHLPSAISKLSSNSNVYSKITYTIDVPSQSKSQVSAEIALVAGSATGTAWFDNASFELAGGEQKPSSPTYKQCYVEGTAAKYSQASMSSAQSGSFPAGDRVDVYEMSNDHFIECHHEGQYFLERKYINTAKSSKTSTRNATNMFGSTTLKYAKPTPEQAKVYNLQWALNRLGYNCGTVDGKFGQGTDKAVRDFQKSQGLTVDGKVGSNTKAALISALNDEDT